MVVLVDSHERYAYTFKRQSGRGHVETVRRGLPAGTMRWNSTAGSWSPVERKVAGRPVQQPAERQVAFRAG